MGSQRWLVVLLTLLLLSLTLASDAQQADKPSRQQAHHANPEQLAILKPQDHRGVANGAGPAHNPGATAAPSRDDVRAPRGSYKTAFHKCKADGGPEERCGWYAPAVKAQARRELSMGVVIPAVFGAAGVFAWGLL